MKQTSHPVWEKLLKGTHESLAMMRRYSMDYYLKHNRSMPVAEAVAMTKRCLASVSVCWMLSSCLVRCKASNSWYENTPVCFSVCIVSAFLLFLRGSTVEIFCILRFGAGSEHWKRRPG